MHYISKAQIDLLKKVVGAAEGFHFVADRAMIAEADTILKGLLAQPSVEPAIPALPSISGLTNEVIADFAKQSRLIDASMPVQWFAALIARYVLDYADARKKQSAAFVPITADMVTDEIVEAVEDDVSMGHYAWDIVDPKELIAKVVNTWGVKQ